MITDYDIDMLKLAYRLALNSPDASTQNGAVVETEGFRSGFGYNTFPFGVKSTPERLERPMKYNFTEHAERNAIFDCCLHGYGTNGATMWVPWFACSDCARAIIQAGIVRVVGHKQMFDDTPSHWHESIGYGNEMFREARVQTELIDMKLGCDPIRFNGELWYP